MNALPDVPEVRLFTSEQAAKLVGGGQDEQITKNTFDALARSGCEHTRLGRKIRWTIPQIKAALDQHRHAQRTVAEEAKVSATLTRETRSTRASERRRGDIAPLVSKPGSRYAAAH
ncbi:hypothetical protein ACFYUV_38280 [Nonomuraea sp. NPDC003560]|uniref:hypothetical protein n=1 Tax=Nonomuraea sp. NPDC003560 TaxID=3364341 RepID=UPI0036BBEB42